MKCSFLLPLAACGVVLMASCADERESFMRGSDCVTFTVADWQSVADTRVDVGIDQNGASFLWTEGDTLGVFPTNGFQTAFPISAGSGTNAAQWHRPEIILPQIEKLVPMMMQSGGYIFASDHSIPAAVSLKDFEQIIQTYKRVGTY